MKLISLGLGDISFPRAASGAARFTAGEIGTTGTPIFAGYLRDPGEYKPELTGLSAFATYERMRRGDAQVAATLSAIKLPIRKAKWVVRGPEDPTPAEQEATEFIQEEFFEREIELDAVIENALLMLDFGCAAHEDVWYADGGRIRLKKLAARLPLTFQRFVVDAEENLTGIEQYGCKVDAYVTRTVPADRLALFTFQQEGANFAGRSLLRAMYTHWFVKGQLYKIDAIALERNGLGVPVIKPGANAKREDLALAKDWVRRIGTHQDSGLALPGADWAFSFEGLKGTTRDPKGSIEHHNVQISKAALAQMLDLGQSASGNRALGQSMSDFFMLSLDATAWKIARVLNWTTIPRLVDLNFEGIERYPEIVPQEIMSIQFEALVKALTTLAGAQLVEPDDDMEKWLREKLGAPDKGTPRKQPQPQVAAPAAKPEGADSADAPTVENPAPPVPQQDNPTTKGQADVSASAGAFGNRNARPAEFEGMQLRREPKPYERCLALGAIVGELDRGRDEIATALRQARSRVQAEIVHKLMAVQPRKMHQVSVAPDAKLLAEVETIIRRVYEFGVEQVGAELQRQRAGKAPEQAVEIRLADRRRPPRDDLGVYAGAVVAEFQNNLQSRAANAALDWTRRPGDTTKGEQIRAVEEELDGQSDKWLDSVASKGANEAFADGRQDGYEEHADEIGAAIYSALLDINTCTACAAADGEEGKTPDEITPAPNPECDGGDKCRCVHVFVMKDEERG